MYMYVMGEGRVDDGSLDPPMWVVGHVGVSFRMQISLSPQIYIYIYLYVHVYLE